MPEYHIDYSLDKDGWNRLGTFTQGYIEAAFWTECNSDNEELENATFADLSQTALATMVADCAAFQKDNAADIDLFAYDYSENQAGHDFWLTRNHHGAGFWDRKIAANGPQAWCDRLTKAAHGCGECNLYMGDDEQVHCD